MNREQWTEDRGQRTMNSKNKFRFLDWQMYKDAKELLSSEGFITNDEFSAVFQKINSIDNQLGGFKKKLQSEQYEHRT
jgi:hypothetical protein